MILKALIAWILKRYRPLIIEEVRPDIAAQDRRNRMLLGPGDY